MTAPSSRPASYNHCNPRDKASALAILDVCGGNFAEAARLTCLPWTTLRDWKRQERTDAVLPATSDLASVPTCLETKLAHLLEEKIEMMVAAITPERLAECSLPQILSSLKLILDRVQSLRTAETVAYHLAVDAIIADRKRLCEVMRKYIPDQATRHAIGQEMDNFPSDEASDEASALEEPTPSREPAVEQGNRHPSFACERGAGGESQSDGGVRATPREAAPEPLISRPLVGLRERAGTHEVGGGGESLSDAGREVSQEIRSSESSETSEISLPDLSPRHPQNPTTKPQQNLGYSAGS